MSNSQRPTRQEMCDKLKLQLDNMEAINTACNENDNLTREEHEDYREPLSYDIEKKVCVLLSWGGPSDGFDIFFSQENEPLHGVYFWQDWGTHDEIELNPEELDQIVDFYFYGEPSIILDASK